MNVGGQAVSHAAKACLRAIGSVLGILFLLCAGQAMAMDVRKDMGGSVEDRLDEIARLEQAGTPVRIVGTCVSACTLYLGLATACVMPKARLGFHGPSTRLKGLPLPREEFERLSRLMAAQYPPAIRAWFMAEARMVTGDYITISGAEAIRLGARPCA